MLVGLCVFVFRHHRPPHPTLSAHSADIANGMTTLRCGSVCPFGGTNCGAPVLKLLAVRRLLLQHDRNRLLDAALVNTQRSSSDLPELTLNRVAAMRKTGKPLGHQLAVKLNQLMPKELRCHRRAFKVKFEGEGVGDLGGPYYELLSNVCEEISADPDESSGRVTVLAPCPNSRNGAGRNSGTFLPVPPEAYEDVVSAESCAMQLRMLGVLMGLWFKCKCHRMFIDLGSVTMLSSTSLTQKYT